MARSEEDRQFELWRTSGDSEALARVFDLTAPRLLLVALHVSRNSSRADDLVQATFLGAMRDSAQWDSAQPVYRWLTGILNHRALDEFRRRRVRAAQDLEATELPGDGRPGPLQTVLEGELADSVAKKVDALPAPYRDVLILRLVHGLEPVEIAHSLQRSPSTVRMQLKRGLERLRRELPESLALPALFAVDAGQGLAAVRAAVLSEASVLSAASGAVTGLNLSWWSLIAMQTKTTWIIVSACLGLFTAMWMNRGASTFEGRTASETAEASEGKFSSARRGPAREGDEARNAAAGIPRERSSITVPESDRATSLRVVVRIEGAGPAAGIGVHLGRVDHPGPGTERTTGSDGTALFADLDPGVFTVTPDRGDAFEAQVLGGVENEIVALLAKGIRVYGEVLDLADQPVPGARVYRHQTAHPNLLQAIATADENGRFVVDNVPERSDFVARAVGYQPSRERSARRTTEGTHELTLRMGARGHRLAGVVLNARGESAGPVLVAIAVDEDARRKMEGVTPEEVEEHQRASSKPLERETILVRADAGGRFEVDEIPAGPASLMARGLGDDGALVATALTVVRPHGQNGVTLQLAPAAELSGRVADESGRPFIRVPIQSTWDGSDEFGCLEDDLGRLYGGRQTLTDEKGEYRLTGLLPGEHDLYVGTRRDALARGDLEVAAGEHAVWSPILEVRSDLPVRLEGPTGEALAGWGVRAVAPNVGSNDFRMGLAETAEDGRCVLELKGHDPHQLWVHSPLGEMGGMEALDPLPCRVIEEVLGGADELVVRLAALDLPSATITGRLLPSSEAALERPRVSLQRVDVELGHPVSRVQVEFASDGRFALDGLAPGMYELRGLARGHGTESLGTWRLGEREQLDVGDLFLSAPTTLIVRLRSDDGSNLENPVVLLRDGAQGAGGYRSFSQEDDGRDDEWTRDALVPGSYRLIVHSQSTAPLLRTIEVGGGGEQLERFVCRRGYTRDLVVALDGVDATGAAPAPAGRLDLTVRDAAGTEILFEKSEDLEPGADAEVTFGLRLEAGRYTGIVRDRRYPDAPEVEVPFEIGPTAPRASVEISIP